MYNSASYSAHALHVEQSIIDAELYDIAYNSDSTLDCIVFGMNSNYVYVYEQ